MCIVNIDIMDTHRRYDIDWLRVIAIGLLLIYHVAIVFQPWGVMIGFITSKEPWVALWAPMALMNVWRIPLLFFVSGMGVYLAMRQRTWRQLLLERSRRILVPYLLGAVLIVPLASLIWRYYNHFRPHYDIGPAHLWFLGNILVYVVMLSPIFFYLKDKHGTVLAHGVRWILSTPWGLLVVMLVMAAEAILVNPVPYELYAMTWHGFYLGLLAFFFGYGFMYSGTPFWQMVLRWRWMFLFLSASLYVIRLFYFELRTPLYLVSIESTCWIFAILGFGHRYLNRPGRTLTYLSEAAYPVYIIHIVMMFLSSWLVLPWNVPVQLKFVLVLVLTVAGCFVAFEVVKRVGVLRVLFGMKRGGRSAVDINKPGD
jgi:glucans biosynthesis protein C